MFKEVVERARRIRYGQIGAEDRYSDAVEGRHGIEVGGPSALFRRVLPLYRHVASLDGINFATDTMWEGVIADGQPFRYYRNRPGRQIIADATDLRVIPGGTYDFLLSSNCLEHIANPIKALLEWKRVVTPGGALVLVLPNKESNFDHRRPVSTLEHLRGDFSRDVGEDDLTHLEEILALHDLKRDKPAGTLTQFRERSLQNLHNRGLHHHVFDTALIGELLDEIGVRTVDVSVTRTDFYALARKGQIPSFTAESRQSAGSGTYSSRTRRSFTGRAEPGTDDTSGMTTDPTS